MGLSPAQIFTNVANTSQAPGNQPITGSSLLPPSTGVLGATTVAPAPTAPAGPTAAQTQAESDFSTNLGGVRSSTGDTINTNAGDYNHSILDYLASLKQQQIGVNSDSTQNELAREQGLKSITDMVGNGVKSGGVILSNDNAGSSSAGEALARAYSTLGRQQASSVGNQFAQGENKIQSEQDALNAGTQTQAGDFNQKKLDTINGIVNDARTKLTQLNQMATYANITDRVDIDKEIAAVRQQATDALTQYDSTLNSGISSNVPQTADATRAKAAGLLNAGTAPESAFNYTATEPTQLSNSGPVASSLPIFTTPAKKQVTA